MVVQLFVDGALAGTRTAVEDANHIGACKLGTPDYVDEGGGLMNGERNALLIGGSGDRWFVCNTWRGWVDEFAIYGGILSEERIAAHYSAWEPKDCAEVRARGIGLDGDLDKDCDVDLFDYASFALQWASCNTPGGAGCTQNW
jgi:hypothetical protein